MLFYDIPKIIVGLICKQSLRELRYPTSRGIKNIIIWDDFSEESQIFSVS